MLEVSLMPRPLASKPYDGTQPGKDSSVFPQARIDNLQVPTHGEPRCHREVIKNFYSLFVADFQTGRKGVLQIRDNWGIGYYYDAPSSDLKDSLSPLMTIRDEQGMEIFYNFAVTPWFTVGWDLQVINPCLGEDTAVFAGLRSVVRF